MENNKIYNMLEFITSLEFLVTVMAMLVGLYGFIVVGGIVK